MSEANLLMTSILINMTNIIVIMTNIIDKFTLNSI